MKTVRIPQAKALLSYHYISGDKPAHVYLAGLGLASTGLYPSQIYGSELARYQSIMPDFLGFGYSQRPDDFGYTVDDHAECIAFLLDRVEERACTVIGHSFGGAVATALATRRPDLVARLVLAESVLDAGKYFVSAAQSEEQYLAGGFQETMAQFRQWFPYYPESGLGWFPMMEHASPLAFYRTARSLAQPASPTWREQLYQLTIPRLFLIGELSMQLKTHRVAKAVTNDRASALLYPIE